MHVHKMYVHMYHSMWINLLKVLFEVYLYINTVNTYTTGCPLSKKTPESWRFVILPKPIIHIRQQKFNFNLKKSSSLSRSMLIYVIFMGPVIFPFVCSGCHIFNVPTSVLVNFVPICRFSVNFSLLQWL